MRFGITKLQLTARAQRAPPALPVPAQFPGLPCSSQNPGPRISPSAICSSPSDAARPVSGSPQPGLPLSQAHLLDHISSLLGPSPSPGKCPKHRYRLYGCPDPKQGGRKGHATSPLPASPTGSPHCSWIPWQSQSRVLP